MIIYDIDDNGIQLHLDKGELAEIVSALQVCYAYGAEISPQRCMKMEFELEGYL